jgi:ubiquinone/menaquinone biosynthesis C-methylase UbiE
MNQPDPKHTEKVRNWWNDHPFTAGVGTSAEQDLTGRVSTLDINTFNNIERRMRKWWKGATYEKPEDPLISKMVPYSELQGKDVLDIAIGSGWSVVDFAKAGANVTGIDLTDEAIKMTTEHLKIKGLNATLKRMDAQNLEFPDNSFDYVLGWGCFMHMPDTPGAIKQVYRVLKPGGRTCSYWYNKSSWTYWFNFIFLRGILLGKLIKYRFNTTRLVSRYTDGAAKGGNELTKVFSPKELKAMHEAAGFKDVRVEVLCLPGEVEGWPAGKFPIFRYLPQGIRKWLGDRYAWGLIVYATK